MQDQTHAFAVTPALVLSTGPDLATLIATSGHRRTVSARGKGQRASVGGHHREEKWKAGLGSRVLAGRERGRNNPGKKKGERGSSVESTKHELQTRTGRDTGRIRDYNAFQAHGRGGTNPCKRTLAGKFSKGGVRTPPSGEERG